MGFDISGNVRDGIFISSILGSGPARDSGLVHRGDRIKCLNISFEGITLQDARDILNCGAPYKLRLLLEKGNESARDSSNRKQRNNPLAIVTNSINSNSGINLTTRRTNRSKTMNILTSTENNNRYFDGQDSKQSGPFNATKSYIRKLSNLVSPLSQSVAHKSASALDDARRANGNEGDRQLTMQNPNLTSYSESQLKTTCSVEHRDRSGQQNSLAAKRHLSSGDRDGQVAGAMLDLTNVGISRTQLNSGSSERETIAMKECQNVFKSDVNTSGHMNDASG